MDGSRLNFIKGCNSLTLNPNEYVGKDTKMAFLVAMILRLGHTIHGGFVRDWIIRGDSATDIDVLVQGNGSNFMAVIMAVKEELIQKIQTSSLSGTILFKSVKKKGEAFTIVFSLPDSNEGDIEIDFVSAIKSTTFPPPGVSADVDNFSLNPNFELVMTNPRGNGYLANKLSHSTAIQHCLQKKFVFFYKPGPQQDTGEVDPDICERRLNKLFQRGWTCIGICGQKSDLNNTFFQRFNKSYFQLEDSLCREWNSTLSSSSSSNVNSAMHYSSLPYHTMNNAAEKAAAEAEAAARRARQIANRAQDSGFHGCILCGYRPAPWLCWVCDPEARENDITHGEMLTRRTENMVKGSTLCKNMPEYQEASKEIRQGFYAEDYRKKLEERARQEEARARELRNKANAFL